MSERERDVAIESVSAVLVVCRGMNACMLVSMYGNYVSTAFTADSLFAVLPLPQK